jgi:hypothetical protein
MLMLLQVLWLEHCMIPVFNVKTLLALRKEKDPQDPEAGTEILE